jgi:hypothetical protein
MRIIKTRTQVGLIYLFKYKIEVSGREYDSRLHQILYI